jgi:hypothetical protein
VPNEVAGVLCQNKECRVSETGKCVEGFALDKCPHIARGTTTVEAPRSTGSDETSGNDDSSKAISLPSGERLPVSTASEVLRASEARVLAIIGPTSSGKTSLIAALYETFQKTPLGDFRFARSRTLFAFEQACHDARAASRRPEPQTEHTGHTPLPGGVSFYHLGLRNRATSRLLDLVIADRTGEDYRSAADDPSISSGFPEVKRADSLTLLVDGERLLDRGARHNVRSEIELILQALVDADTTSTSQRVSLVLTKLDKIRSAAPAEGQRTERDFEALVESVQRLFGDFFKKVLPMQVAASPKTNVLPHGYGVSDLLQFWTAPLAILSGPDVAVSKPTRAMERFTVVE